DPEKSLEQGAILPWRRGGKRMVTYYKAMLRAIAAHYQQSLETPYKDLPEEFKRVLLHGSGETEIDFNFLRAGKVSRITRPFEGVLPNLERLYHESESEFTRNRLKAFMSPRFCDACNGERLKPEILAVRIGGAAERAAFQDDLVRARSSTRESDGGPPQSDDSGSRKKSGTRLTERLPGLSIMELCALSVDRAEEFFAGLKLTDFQ